MLDSPHVDAGLVLRTAIQGWKYLGAYDQAAVSPFFNGELHLGMSVTRFRDHFEQAVGPPGQPGSQEQHQGRQEYGPDLVLSAP